MVSKPSFNATTGGWDVGYTRIFVALEDGDGSYKPASQFKPSRAHVYAPTEKLYVLADPGDGKGVRGQRFSLTIENNHPTDQIGYMVLLDGAIDPNVDVTAGKSRRSLEAGRSVTLKGFYNGGSTRNVVKHFQFNLRDSFADKEIEDRGWQRDAMQGCKIEVKLIAYYKLSTPENKVKPIASSSSASSSSSSFSKARGTDRLEAVPHKKASAGYAVEIAKPTAHEMQEISRAAASASASASSSSHGHHHHHHHHHGHGHYGHHHQMTETVSVRHWKVVDSNPHTIVAFHVRDAQIHKHSSVEMIHRGVIPNLGTFNFAEFEASQRRQSAGSGAGASSSSSSSSSMVKAIDSPAGAHSADGSYAANGSYTVGTTAAAAAAPDHNDEVGDVDDGGYEGAAVRAAARAAARAAKKSGSGGVKPSVHGVAVAAASSGVPLPSPPPAQSSSVVQLAGAGAGAAGGGSSATPSPWSSATKVKAIGYRASTGVIDLASDDEEANGGDDDDPTNGDGDDVQGSGGDRGGGSSGRKKRRTT